MAEEENSSSKKNPINLIFWPILLVLFIALFVLIIANLAFFKIIPPETSSKMPIIGKKVVKMIEKEKQINIAKQIIKEKRLVKKIGELEVDLREETIEDQAVSKVPFLYKLRAVRNKVNGKEFAEIWIDRILVIRFYVGIDENDAYARAKFVVKKINSLLNDGTSFKNLMPIIDNNEYKAIIGKNIIVKVGQQDAIFNNTTSHSLLYSWVNNIRTAFGYNLIKEPKLIPKKKKQEIKPERAKEKEKEIEIEKKEQEQIQQEKKTEKKETKKQKKQKKQKKITPPPATKKTPSEEERIKKLKKTAAIYEKMALDKLPPILTKKNKQEVIDVLAYLSTKKIIKLFSSLPTAKTVTYYRYLTKGQTERHQKQFKKITKVWEKMSTDLLLKVFKKLKKKEATNILKKLSVKKKAKIFSQMTSNESKYYLDQLSKQ